MLGGMSDDDYEREYAKLTDYEEKIISEMTDEIINEGLRKLAEEKRNGKQEN